MRRLGVLLILAAALGSTVQVNAQTVQEFVLQATALEAHHQPLQAIELLKRAVLIHPNSPEILFHLGASLLEVGQVEAADRMLHRAGRLAPGNATILKRSAEAKLRAGNTDEAVKLLEKTIWYSPGDAEAQHRLSFSLFVLSDQDGALKAIEKAVDLDPLSPKYRRFYAQLLSFDDQTERSLQQLRIAFRLEPNNTGTLYQLSQEYRRKGSLGQAIEYMEMASELDPENPLYRQEISRLYHQANDPRRAAEAGAQATRLLEAFHAYSQALELSGTGRIEEAIALLEAVTARAESFVTGRLFLASLYQKKGQERQAERVFEEVLARNPESPQALRETAWIRANKGDLESALQLLQASSGNVQPDLSLLQGYRYLTDENWTAALEIFESLGKRYPLDTGLLQLMSSCLSELGRQQSALQNLARAVQLEPDNGELREQVNNTLLEQAQEAMNRQDWQTAREILLSLVRREPNNADYRFRLGYSYQRSGRLEAAVREYRSGLSSHPEESWAVQNLATCLSLLQRYDEAGPLWEQLAGDSPTAEVLLQLGLVYSHLGRDAEAERVFQKCLRLGGEQPVVLYNLGIARLRLMKLEEGWKVVRLSARQGYQPAVSLLRQARLEHED